MFKTLLFILLTFLMLINCKQKSVQKVDAEYFAGGPKLVKIPVAENTNIDSLINSGMEIIVIEKDYFIARLDQDDAANMQALALNMETFQESELVQRLIRIIVKNDSDFYDLNNSGIDIWETKGDTVIAQAFDIQIRQIERLNYTVEIIEKNIRNLAGDSGKK